MKPLKLPKGCITIFDEMMIAYLCNDEVFKASVEETEGKIKRMYPDWSTNMLVYEMLDGEFKYSDLKKIVKNLNEMNYMKEYEN